MPDRTPAEHNGGRDPCGEWPRKPLTPKDDPDRDRNDEEPSAEPPTEETHERS